MRYAVNPIILLSNNGSYTIESEIHDGWAAALRAAQAALRAAQAGWLAGAPWWLAGPNTQLAPSWASQTDLCSPVSICNRTRRGAGGASTPSMLGSACPPGCSPGPPGCSPLMCSPAGPTIASKHGTGARWRRAWMSAATWRPSRQGRYCCSGALLVGVEGSSRTLLAWHTRCVDLRAAAGGEAAVCFGCVMRGSFWV